MHAADHGETARRYALDIIQALDDMQGPQGPVQVERPVHDPADQNIQLPPVPRPGQGNVTHVIFQIEPVVIHPIGMIEAQWHALNLLPEARGQWQPRFHVAQDILEPQHSAGDRGLIVDVKTADMVRDPLVLQIQERGIQRAKLFQGHDTRPVLSSGPSGAEPSGLRRHALLPALADNAPGFGL